MWRAGEGEQPDSAPPGGPQAPHARKLREMRVLTTPEQRVRPLDTRGVFPELTEGSGDESRETVLLVQLFCGFQSPAGGQA